MLAVWRNPLARGTDRPGAGVAMLLIFVWLFMLPVVAAAGSLRWEKISLIAADEQRTHTQSATACWGAPDGSERIGTIDTAGEAKTANTEQIWVDGSGNVSTPPMTGTSGAVLLILVSVAAWLMLGTLLGAVWLAVRWRLNRGRLAAWDSAWQQVEPQWSGRQR